MGLALTFTEDILRKAFKHFAENTKLTPGGVVLQPQQVQLIISTFDENTFVPAFQLYYNQVPAQIKRKDKDGNEFHAPFVTFLEVLNKDIDFLNREALAQPVLIDSLKKFYAYLCEYEKVYEQRKKAIDASNFEKEQKDMQLADLLEYGQAAASVGGKLAVNQVEIMIICDAAGEGIPYLFFKKDEKRSIQIRPLDLKADIFMEE